MFTCYDKTKRLRRDCHEAETNYINFIMLSCVFLVGGCVGKTEVPEVRQEKAAEKTGKDTMIYVVRHGKTMLNEAKRAQGWADAPFD